MSSPASLRRTTVGPTHPTHRFISPSHSLRFSPSRTAAVKLNGTLTPSQPHETGFKSISGASVSANTSTPKTVVHFDNIITTDNNNINNNNNIDFSGLRSSGFESTASFSALPLQPLPRGDSTRSGSGRAAVGQMERGFFMSGPIERGALSGPLDSGMGMDSVNSNGVPFSAPLNGSNYVKKRRKRSIRGIRKAFNRNFVSGRKESRVEGSDVRNDRNNDREDVQWALGKAGEDRVHVVVSEEHGWLFVGIYDGFNGPDAPEFLMGNLYKAMYKELEGLFWDLDDSGRVEEEEKIVRNESLCSGEGGEIVPRRKRLWEYLAEEGLDLSGSERFAFSVDDALNISKTNSEVNHRSLLLSKLRNGFGKHKDGSKLFGWRFSTKEQKEVETRIEETDNVVRNGRKRKSGPVDHELVLRAMSRALEVTESAYLDMTDKVMDQYPELALMGSCLLAVLMRDEDVYVMNLGDSRAIVAQHGETVEGVTAEDVVVRENDMENERRAHDRVLTALQLSTDHSTSIEEEVTRIKNEHPDDDHCIVNDRVKGRLKVTRAFGVGSLKQAKWNDSLLEMFRNEYIGNAPYISCVPSLRHHQLCQKDQFLVLSSDGLYQYFSNQEVVSHVDSFMEKFPDGDPAQHLIEELLLRAAKKAGMDLHELLDIPQGDRRKYHDDVTVMVVSLEGRIWKSSGKYL
ncbi:hypothetical protein M8C21_024380 [Ambrosia artemisiifolia]|uniref:protein-serine/threonine phosphatase n=1 Tax=Ambrosia artemisiifolia TaxID=4212 RepID=A0AAD5GFL9_AMBAR|nr:hypothetical protein M8C21_024380 [Ambrosia artemisiifolia]